MPQKQKKTKRIIIIVLLVILALISALLLTYFILYHHGKMQFHKNDKNIVASEVDGLEIDEDSITYNGKNYSLNKDVVSILFMGIDKERIGNNLGYGKNGQADSIFVAAINTSTKKIKLIPIQRETMVDVNAYSKDGKFVGTNFEQICLAFAYGNDAAKSCENVKTSVSRYLMGINISSYVAIDLDGVEVITNKIGGVPLTAIESVTYNDRKCSVGESLLLKGKNARLYIQDRTETLDGSTKRLQRQKQFLSAFASTAGNQILTDFTKLKLYYDTMIPFISTDLSFSQISYLATACLTRDIGNIFEYETIEGEMIQNGKFAEFTPDNNSLVNAIITAFYSEN